MTPLTGQTRKNKYSTTYKNFSRSENKWWGAVLLIALNFWAKFNVCRLSSSTSKCSHPRALVDIAEGDYMRQHLPSKKPMAQIHCGPTNAELRTSTLMTMSCHVLMKVKTTKRKQNKIHSLPRPQLHLTGKAFYVLTSKSTSNHYFLTFHDPEFSFTWLLTVSYKDCFSGTDKWAGLFEIPTVAIHI